MISRRAFVLAAVLSSGVAGTVFVLAPRYVAMLPAAFVGLIGVTAIAALVAVRDLSRRNAVLLVGLATACISAVVAFVGLPLVPL